jgi:hypothetical protein
MHTSQRSAPLSADASSSGYEAPNSGFKGAIRIPNQQQQQQQQQQQPQQYKSSVQAHIDAIDATLRRSAERSAAAVAAHTAELRCCTAA